MKNELLIKLFKKYSELKNYSNMYFDSDGVLFWDAGSAREFDFSEGTVQYLVSKEFGFVYWLFRNNKIDLNKLSWLSSLFIDGVDPCTLLLCFLSLSEDPLLLLSSLLKE